MSAIRLSRVKLRWDWAGLAVRLDFVSFLLVVSVLLFPRIATGQGSNQGETAVVFFAEPRVEAAIWPSLTGAFYDEVMREESEYPLPGDVKLVRASSLVTGQEFAKVIQVHLIGRCDVVQQAERVLPRGPLGWVLDVSGEIQPFVYIHCGRVAQFLNPTTLGMNEDERREAMARAISRIAIHEWIHIDAQTARHENHGIRKAELTSGDLIARSGVRSRAGGGR